MKTVVVMPTYNEQQNAPRLVKALHEQGLAVLVVDDNSPDGTAKAVRALGLIGVSVLSGPKQGLGNAYKRGIKHALQAFKADVVVQMDADWSHDPKDVHRLLSALKDADVAIGSRYVEGGAIEGWNAQRKMLSKGGNAVARTVAGLGGVRDCTAGFRAIKASALKDIDWESFPARGYAFQIMLVERLLASGARIAEVPVTFRDRTLGKTKLGLRDIVEFGYESVRMGWRAHDQVRRFLIVGATGVLVNLGLFTFFLRVLELQVYFSWLIALEASILWNFLLHDKYTFPGRGRESLGIRIGRYHLTAAGGVAINFLIFWSLLHVLFPEAANVVAIGVATTWNYLLSKGWAWKKRK